MATFRCREKWAQIMESPSVMLAGMEGSSLGVWVAHGEGRAHFPDSESRTSAVEAGLAPIRCVAALHGWREFYKASEQMAVCVAYANSGKGGWGELGRSIGWEV